MSKKKEASLNTPKLNNHNPQTAREGNSSERTRHQSKDSSVVNQQKKDKNDVQNVSCLETRSKAGADNKVEHMPVDADTHADSKFNLKCICDWSKDDKFGFIPNTECPVHGKQTKEFLKGCVDLNGEGVRE